MSSAKPWLTWQPVAHEGSSVDLHHLLLVYTAYIIAAASPGPSNMRIMGTAMRQGRNAALLLAAGVVTGSVFWGVMAATGISAILARYAHALIVLKILGGVYLLFLAVKAARRAAVTNDDAGQAVFIGTELGCKVAIVSFVHVHHHDNVILFEL